MRHSLLVLSAFAAAVVGCGEAGPPPEQRLAKSVAELQTQAAAVVAAFDKDDPQAADGPLHKIGGPFKTLRATAAELEADTAAAVRQAADDVFEAFADIHEPMHEEEFPTDFDFAPIRERLINGVEALRAALPVAARDLLPPPMSSSASNSGPATTEPATTEPATAGDG